MLECISKGYGQLCRGLISEEEFENLIKGTDLRKKCLKSLRAVIGGHVSVSKPDAYIKAKGLFGI